MRLVESLIATVVVLSLLVFAAVWAVGLVIDPTDNTDAAIREANLSTEDAAFNLLVEALSGVNDDGVATVTLDKRDMNELLYSIAPKLKFGSIEARSIYIEEQGFAYKLCVPISLSGIETLLWGTLDMFCEDDVIFLRVSDLHIAKTGIGSGILSLFNIEEIITSALDKLSIESSFSNGTLTVKLTRENIGSLVAMGLKEDKNAGLFMALYNLLMLRTDAVDIAVESPASATLTVNFNLFDGVSDSGLSSVNEYTRDLLDRGLIAKEQVNLAAKYHINGYDRLTDEEKATLTSLLGEEDEITDYAGIVERKESPSLTQILIDQLYYDGSFNPNFNISDGNINAMLSGIDLVGTVWQFSHTEDNSCVYIAIKDIYCSISEDYITVLLDVDINGYVITVEAGFACGESPLVAITGTLDGASVGGVTLEESEVDLTFSFLCQYINMDWIYTDAEARSLTLDFTSTFSGSEILLAIINGSWSRIVTTCERSALTDTGFVSISFKIFQY